MSRVALVTGGGRGFGRAFALALANNGWRVAMTSRTQSELDETLSLLSAGTQSSAVAYAADVTDAAPVERLVQTVEGQCGPIELLVNNAGLGPPFGPTWETEAEDWWRNIEVNLKGPMLCCRAVVPAMMKRSSGRIVNIASGAGTVSIPYLSAYVTSKAALIRFTEVLADELRPHGITVFAVEPGTVRTKMAEGLIQSETGKRWLPWFQRIFEDGHDVSTKPAEALLLHLASGKADSLSGRFFSAVGPTHNLNPDAEDTFPHDLGVLRLRS